MLKRRISQLALHCNTPNIFLNPPQTHINSPEAVQQFQTIRWLERALGLQALQSMEHKYILNSIKNFEMEKPSMFPLDSLSKPYSKELVKRGEKRLQKIDANNWGIMEFKLYSILMLGRLSKNDCLALLEQMSGSRGIPLSSVAFEQWEAMIQSIVLVDDDLECARSFYKLALNFNPSMEDSLKIALAMAIGSLYRGDLIEFTKIFREMRNKWWPFSSSIYTQLIAAHCDYLIRHQYNFQTYIPSTCQNGVKPQLLQGVRSLRWILKHQHLTGLPLNSYQNSLLIIGYSRANLLQKALRIYHWFIIKGGIPDDRMLNVMIESLTRLPYYSTLKTHQAGFEASPSDLIVLIMSHFQRFKLLPSLDTLYIVVRYLSQSKSAHENKIKKYYQLGCDIYGTAVMKDCFKAYMSPSIHRKRRSLAHKRISERYQSGSVWSRIVDSWGSALYVEYCKELGLVPRDQSCRLDWIITEPDKVKDS